MSFSEEISLANGGLAVVILAGDVQIPSDYDLNPQVLPFTMNQISGDETFINQKIPSQTRVVLVSDHINKYVYDGLRNVLARRNVPCLLRKGQDSIANALSELFPNKKIILPANGGKGEKQEESKKHAPKGSLLTLIAQADLSKGTAEEARRLFRIAQLEGISTTLGSLSTGISNRKRKERRGEIPKSVLSPQKQALRVLDEAIESLSLIRSYVESTEQENDELKAQLRKIQEVFGRK